MNIKLTIAYDGSHYLGWQKTNMGPSIEGTLEHALSIALQEPVFLQAASRTDAGVHAEEQVVNFTTAKNINLSKLHHSLKGLLPKDISVLQVQEVHENFHPTLDALGKEYHYHLCLSSHQLPFHRNYSWHFYYPLDIALAQEAAHLLLGTHNFSAFTTAPNSNPIRHLNSITIEPLPHHRLKIVIIGESFLYKMVRTLVGTFLYVGCGKLPLSAIPLLLQNKDRKQAGVTAPAHGLTLKKVLYKNC